MSLVPEDVLVEGSHQTIVKWWVTAPVNQDSYYFFFVRYDTVSGEVQRADYWAEDKWTEYQVGEVIKPFLVMPGFVATLIASTAPTDQQKAVNWMQDTCMSILLIVDKALEEEDSETRTQDQN